MSLVGYVLDRAFLIVRRRLLAWIAEEAGPDPAGPDSARSGVTRAVRQAIARIGERDRELGEHLDGAVRTGARPHRVRGPNER